MKFYLVLIGLLFTTLTSMAQGTSSTTEGAPADTAQQGGVFTSGATKCPECLKHLKDPYNGPMINTNTNYRKVEASARPGGSQGTDTGGGGHNNNE